MAVNTTAIVIIVIAVVLLIVQAVLSTLSAIEIRKGQSAASAGDATIAFNKAHMYSTAAAVVAALCIIGLVISIYLVVRADRILTAAHTKLGEVINAHPSTPQPVAAAASGAAKAAGSD